MHRSPHPSFSESLITAEPLNAQPKLLAAQTRQRVGMKLKGPAWLKSATLGAALLTEEGCMGMEDLPPIVTTITSGGTHEASTSGSTGDNVTASGYTTGEMSTGGIAQTGADTIQITTGTEACPPDYCMPNNTQECVMSNELKPVCVCKEGAEGPQCEACAQGYENVGIPENVQCELDTTGPKAPVITEPNLGDDLLILSKTVFIQATIDGPDSEKGYYRINHPPYDELQAGAVDEVIGMEPPEPLIALKEFDPNNPDPLEGFYPGGNAMYRDFFVEDKYIGTPLQIEYYVQDANGNLNPPDMSEKSTDKIQVTRAK